ncbi:hypothetical protein GCM10007385_01640 [Tateyamaria omphalii]|uniref:flagellar biosynthesis protein FlgN n=1 Tax=Tateyamaria omphalii TaxID=299262 RepID=UPI00167BBB7A|nr:flagellar biosynthesis protein FlgN [Tateyamaria omphalii]GGX38471.1 hypothetical protein GCM10007385_01640 [Tateyamaria omphalii]
MKMNEYQGALEELEDLLDAEKAAVLEGKLDDVGRLLDQKTRLLEFVGGSESSNAKTMTKLRNKLERNQSLLESAADGVRSVSRRLSAVRQVRESLETYDSLGRRRNVTISVCHNLEKKA